MREMVLNHCSFVAPTQDMAVDWLKDLIVGISQIVGAGMVEATLRARHYSYDVYCMPETSLFSISLDLLHRGAHEEFRLFSTLNAKVPLLKDADPRAAARFLACQHRTMDPADGEPLLYCAISGDVSVGFPSSKEWDEDLLTVEFEELLPEGQFEEWSEDIDNVARQQHAASIIDRHRSEVKKLLLESANGAAIWQNREEAFPHLYFGPEVEAHLSMVNPGELGSLILRLASLDEAAAAWPVQGGEAPSWKSKVTDESSSVKTTPILREGRRFRSCRGTRELFFWHARFGSHRRIHLRFDRATFAVELGYIGNHLPIRSS